MKRKLLAFLVVVLTLGLTACSKKQEAQGDFVDESAYFVATVLEVKEDLMLVEVTDKGNSALYEDTQAYVSLDVENVPTLVVGDIVKVSFDGEIMEIYPVRLGEVLEILKINSVLPEVDLKEEEEVVAIKYSNSLGIVEDGVIYSETEISDTHRDTIAQLINNAKWSDGTADCVNDVMIKIDDVVIFYHFDCGTLNDTVNNRTYKLTESEQRILSEIMFRYIGFK